MILNDSHVGNGQPAECADVLARLAAVPDTLRRLIGERSSVNLRQPGHDGGHAVVEILCNLQDWEEITGERVSRFLHEESPVLGALDDSLWSIEHDYLRRDALEALEAFAILRARLVTMLTGAGDETWERTADLEEHGTITLRELVELRAAQDLEKTVELGEALR